MTKEEIKQKYEDVATLILDRVDIMLRNEDFKKLDKVHRIQADIRYLLDKTEKEIRDSLQKELNKYCSFHIRHENQM